MFSDKDMPRYPGQTIWPYTDFVQHRLHMEMTSAQAGAVRLLSGAAA